MSNASACTTYEQLLNTELSGSEDWKIASPVISGVSDDECCRVEEHVVCRAKICICNIIVASSIISFAILSGNGRAERALYDMAAKKTWVHGDCEVVGIVFERYKNDKLKKSVTENGGRRLLAAGATWHAWLDVQRLKQHGLDSPLGFRVLDETERFGQIYLGRVDAEAPELGQLDAEALKELEEAAAATTEELEAAAMTEEPDAVFSPLGFAGALQIGSATSEADDELSYGSGSDDDESRRFLYGYGSGDSGDTGTTWKVKVQVRREGLYPDREWNATDGNTYPVTDGNAYPVPSTTMKGMYKRYWVKSNAKKWRDKYTVGDTYTCYWDPDNVGDIAMKNDGNPRLKKLFIIGYCFVGVIGFCVCVCCIGEFLERMQVFSVIAFDDQGRIQGTAMTQTASKPADVELAPKQDVETV